MTNRKHGHVAGQPVRYIRGHVGYLKRRASITPDLWHVTDRGFSSSCWITVGFHNANGYHKVQLRGRSRLAHRAMYEQEVGPIPDGLQIDHLCRQRDCINPGHLEVVTAAINTRRGTGTKLTVESIRAIRAAEGTQAQIASAYGISASNVSLIRSGKRWQDV